MENETVLQRMESIVDIIMAGLSDTNDSNAALEAMFSICSECWIRTISVLKRTDGITDEDRATYAILGAQDIWEQLIKYINDTYSIEYNSLGFILFMKYWVNYINSLEGDCTPLVKTCEHAISELLKYLEEKENVELQGAFDVAAAKPEMLKRYFDLMDELKVFRTDPSTYATDHERDLHNEIMEIFNTIIG